MHSGRLPPGTRRLAGQCRKWPAGSGGGHKVGKATDNSGVCQARQGFLFQTQQLGRIISESFEIHMYMSGEIYIKIKQNKTEISKQ